MDLRYPPWFSIYIIIAIFVNRLCTIRSEFFLFYLHRSAPPGGQGNIVSVNSYGQIMDGLSKQEKMILQSMLGDIE